MYLTDVERTGEKNHYRTGRHTAQSQWETSKGLHLLLVKTRVINTCLSRLQDNHVCFLPPEKTFPCALENTSVDYICRPLPHLYTPLSYMYTPLSGLDTHPSGMDTPLAGMDTPISDLDTPLSDISTVFQWKLFPW